VPFPRRSTQRDDPPCLLPFPCCRQIQFLERSLNSALIQPRRILLGQRQLLADALRVASGDTRYAFLVRQHGLFSTKLDLTSVQIERLITEFHVYLAAGGRNIAGVQCDNVGTSRTPSSRPRPARCSMIAHPTVDLRIAEISVGNSLIKTSAMPRVLPQRTMQ
jgi:hypothetical protein